jgi:hypothetical protein
MAQHDDQQRACQILLAALQTAAQAATHRPLAAGSASLGAREGAVLGTDHGANVWVAPRATGTHVELNDRDGRTSWAGEVDTAALLDHLDRRGVDYAAVVEFLTAVVGRSPPSAPR